MELHVVDTEGLPEGCVLSVRAGHTRRQATVSADRPFRFPTAPGDALPFKVDALEAVASARMIFRPGEERRVDCRYTIPLEATAAPEGTLGEDMSLTIAVRATTEASDAKPRHEGPPKRPSVASSVSSRHCQASAAREYLDRHNLVEFTQLLVQSVIKEQPENPYAFLAKQFYFPEPLGAEPVPPAQEPLAEPAAPAPAAQTPVAETPVAETPVQAAPVAQAPPVPAQELGGMEDAAAGAARETEHALTAQATPGTAAEVNEA